MDAIWRFRFLLVCIFGLLGSMLAEATDLGSSGWSMVVSSDLTRSNQIKIPRVYSEGSDYVVIELDKTFFGTTDAYGAFDPLIVEFQKTSVDAVSQIVIRDEYIVNETDKEWHDFHMFLLVNALAPEAGFDSTQTPYGDQLENVSYSDYDGYNSLPIQLNFTNSSGQGVLTATGDDIFRPGYRSTGDYDPIVIQTDPTLAVGSRFGLKEVPTTPEPVSALIILAGFGLLGLKNKQR
jgi:hypothetical protein